jgi:hypothetical protein
LPTSYVFTDAYYNKYKKVINERWISPRWPSMAMEKVDATFTPQKPVLSKALDNNLAGRFAKNIGVLPAALLDTTMPRSYIEEILAIVASLGLYNLVSSLRKSEPAALVSAWNAIMKTVIDDPELQPWAKEELKSLKYLSVAV